MKCPASHIRHMKENRKFNKGKHYLEVRKKIVKRGKESV
jgi:hypothetical protein